MKSPTRLMSLFFAVGVMLYAQTQYQNTSPIINNNNEAMMSGSCFYHRWQENQTHNGRLDSALIENTNCPVKEMNSEVGVVAPNGKFVPLGPSNRQMITITNVRKHHRHHQGETVLAQNQPINVRVMAMPDGSVVVRPVQ